MSEIFRQFNIINSTWRKCVKFNLISCHDFFLLVLVDRGVRASSGKGVEYLKIWHKFFYRFLNSIWRRRNTLTAVGYSHMPQFEGECIPTSQLNACEAPIKMYRTSFSSFDAIVLDLIVKFYCRIKCLRPAQCFEYKTFLFCYFGESI